MILISVIIYVFGIAVKKRKCTAETTGKVVDKVQGSDNNLYPIIEYEAGGVIYRRKKNVTAHGSINNGYQIGYELIVLYDPEKPKRCLIGGTKDTDSSGVYSRDYRSGLLHSRRGNIFILI